MPTFTLFLRGKTGYVYKVITSTSVNGVYRTVYAIERIRNPFRLLMRKIRRRKERWIQVHTSYVYIKLERLYVMNVREIEEWMQGAITEYEESRRFIKQLK